MRGIGSKLWLSITTPANWFVEMANNYVLQLFERRNGERGREEGEREGDGGSDGEGERLGGKE